MKYVWRKKYELDVGTALPIDPQPRGYNRREYLRCPLCFHHCPEAYWKNHHCKQIHAQCPICDEWFLLPSGLGQHLTRSTCGLMIMDALAELDRKQVGDKIIVKIVPTKY